MTDALSQPGFRLRIEPLDGYSPVIGRLVCMLRYSRERTLTAVEGLSVAALEHRHDAQSNSIGALLSHLAASERIFQVLTFDEREFSTAEEIEWKPRLDLSVVAYEQSRGKSLAQLLDVLAALRYETLTQLGMRDDVWLEAPLVAAPELNAHWAWFHVAEDEISHCGQIQWLKKRLP